MDSLINIRNLHRRFGELHAVQGVSFELKPGEVLGILGPNGAGKSTTMRMLSGCLAPTAGSISLNGFDLESHPLEAKRHLGYLPENPPLYPELAVDEYLLYCARLKQIPAAQRTDALARAKEQCGLERMGRRLIANLSKGYRQRLGIAQAIIHKPAIVILDEPSSGLDPNQIQEIRALIRALATTSGILLSTHILPEVQTVCDRVLIINQGRLVFSRDLKHQDNDRDQVLLIRLGQPPSAETLEQIPGVASAQALDRNLFQLRLEEAAEPADLSRRLVERGWELEEFTPRGLELERIFTRLTSGGSET